MSPHSPHVHVHHDHHDHGEPHAHSLQPHAHHAHLTGRKLAIAFGLSWGILAVLVVGGWFSNSLALLADAGHVLTDIAALGLSWYATWQATRPADHRKTFGYHRTGILAALINAATLIGAAAVIGWEAIARLGHPQPVESGVMMAAAAVGLVLNLAIGLGLRDESAHNLNVRSAFLHVLGDAAASAGVILGALAIAVTGYTLIDPLLSVAIALFIAYGAWQVVDESLVILMEGVPRGLALEGLVADITAIEGVQGLHDLHVWSIARGMTSLSCHLVIADQHVTESMRIVQTCNQLLATKYQIEHTTIQAEAEHCSPDALDCNLALVQGTQHEHFHHH